MAKTKEIAEFGDFQTPEALAHGVCGLLAKQKLLPASLIEPNCGVGNFMFAGMDVFQTIRAAVGVEVNPRYVEQAGRELRQRVDADKAKLMVGNFFDIKWAKLLAEQPEPVLILGNPPWVTNAQLEALDSQNLPEKTNFQRHTGLDAITGKANFDISEWMLIRLLEAINGRRGTLAMLCKSAVARKVLCYGWKHDIELKDSALYRIEADFHFDAAVDAVLLVTHFAPTSGNKQAKVYSWLSDSGTFTTIGYEDGKLLADIDAYHCWKHLSGTGTMKWRSGVKHDCSKVMEFRSDDRGYCNGFGEFVELEDTYVYPMLKSSGVAKGGNRQDMRWMLVTQKAIGENTAAIERAAPKTWEYLQRHANQLDKRRSSIYRNRPAFSVFGVGDYTFAPWKVVISGFYKQMSFFAVGPVDGKPVVLDDTSYFLPCRTKEEADYLASLLNSEPAKAFFGAFVFWDAKRPITSDLLSRLDLRLLARELESEDRYDRYFAHVETKQHKRQSRGAQLVNGLFESSSRGC